jgi:hypothetical protein
MATTTVRLPVDWKDDLIALRDSLPEAVGTSLIAALASRTQEELEALVTTLTQPGGLPPAPVTPAAPPQGTAATAAKIRTDSNAVLPTRRPSEPKPLEEGKVSIILRNDALMATVINGKRYVIDAKLQVTPQELAAIEAELSQRKQWWGNTTRIERLEPA